MTILKRSIAVLITALVPTLVLAETQTAEEPSVDRPVDIEEPTQLLWGDTHLHTNNSFDAFLNGNLSVTPSDAYRFARGEPVIHAYNRARIQIETPLDFLVVTDHAEFLGGIKDIYTIGVRLEDPGLIERLIIWWQERQIRQAIDSGNGPAFFNNVLPATGSPRELASRWNETLSDPIPGADISQRETWHRLVETADAHNEPGKFTAFSGWEWSSQPGSANLHRVVITSADTQSGKQFLPFASTDSPYPEDLWAWLSETEAQVGARFIAIPHNPNVSRGIMFDKQTLRGADIDADYAARRMRYEPIVEVTQIKGDSETHEDLSPNDEFAKFETYAYLLAAESEKISALPGSYVRSALKTGLAIEQKIGANPFKLGMIGSTDSHTGLATAEEPNFWGKFAYDSVPERKGTHGLGSASGWAMSAAGLAAVWAKENTRDGILDAMFRREVYATTGPRIKVRFFGGWAFGEDDLANVAEHGYAKGVPMGGTLENLETSGGPSFLIEASRDPKTDNLDRIQVVKGWVDGDGNTHERVINVAWSDNRVIAEDGALPPLPDSVDRRTGKSTTDHGAASLRVVWTDLDFNPEQAAFYYARVLQVPSARHSLLDQIALGADADESYAEVIQERAYTSPIWYTP